MREVCIPTAHCTADSGAGLPKAPPHDNILPVATKTVPILFVGGFLGAGKTTLLWAAARRLIARGQRVGLVTNDQAPGLVDTEFLRRQGVSVGEVAGSCFCCDFDGLIREAEKLRHSVGADVLIAEPVGSCTDLSATILQPLKENFRENFRVAPLTVLADPSRLEAMLSDGRGGLHPGAAYIFWKQLEEADLIAVNKCDQIDGEARERIEGLLRQRFPGSAARFISAALGEGVEAWLDSALGAGEGGSRIAEVDYDTYAEGEAALGWLNATYELRRPGQTTDWEIVALDVMGRLGLALAEERATIGHLKMLLEAGAQYIAASVTRAGEEPSVRGAISGSPDAARLTINARVELPPETLREIVTVAVTEAIGADAPIAPSQISAFRPRRPTPTHRHRDVIPAAPPPPPTRAPALKRWLAAALFLFLIGYAAILVSREIGHGTGVAPPPGEMVRDGVAVLYCHGHYRCDTCDRIERLTRETVRENFGEALARGAIAWRSINTDLPANAHFTKDYGLVTRTVVLVRTRGGIADEWKKLDRVWDLVDDEAGFKRYVRDEIAGYKGRAK